MGRVVGQQGSCANQHHDDPPGHRAQVAVGQEHVRAVAEMPGQDRIELAEDVEVHLKCVAGVHVLVIAALPAKSLAGLFDA